MTNLIEGLCNKLGNEITGKPLADLAPDRPAQRKWHREGRVEDINQFTREEIGVVADEVLAFLANNITPEMVIAAHNKYWEVHGSGPDAFIDVITAALKAAMDTTTDREGK